MTLAKFAKLADRKYLYIVDTGDKIYACLTEPKKVSKSSWDIPHGYEVYPTRLFGAIDDLPVDTVVLLPRTLDEGDFVRAWKYEKPTKDKDFVYGYIATVGEGGTFTLGGSSEVYVGAEACDPDKLRSVIG